MEKNKKVMIIFYSMYGHVEFLARQIHLGVNSVKGVKSELWRIPETLDINVLKMMNAPEKSNDIPMLTFDKLVEMETSDGFLFGTPTRFGMMSAQMKTMWDQTGRQWAQGSFSGKPAGLFFSTGTQGGGQETTAFTTITQLAHHGMPFVPLGYGFGKEGSTMTEVRGGSAYGSGTFAGTDGSRKPSDLELRIAKFQGESFGKFIQRLH